MTTTQEQTYPQTTDLGPDDYVVLGLATCFLKEAGEVTPVKVLEPIPSACLETLVKGIPTSYEWAIATTLGTILNADGPQLPQGMQEESQLGKDFAYRATAAARSYKSHPNACELLPLGDRRSDFNFNLDRKRVLNPKDKLVTAADNVKQHAHTHKVL
ncbi:MAG: hypothetical protein HC860_02620 [Alkalinema sp. RU_4_3]|nr:hypothetical protein [Alkalinema sp. RU_4_3]